MGKINLWDSPTRRKVVGQLRHGAKVRIVEKVRTDRLYYRVRTFLKQGWVSENFVSPQRHEPLGDVIG